MSLIVNHIRLLCLMPAILMVWFSTSVMADVNHLDTWRSEAAAVRIQAENNAPAAYSEIKHLQSTLPKEATPIDRARLLNLLSRIEVYLARTERAAMHAQQALDLAKQHADKVGQVEAYLNIALNAVNQGKLDVLEAAVNASMEVADDVNRPDLLAESMLQTAMLYHQQGRFDDSVTMAIQTMEIARRSNNAIALMLAHQGMALSYDHSGRMKEAQEHYEQMRKQAKAAQMLRLEADAMIGLGRVDNNLGYYSGGEQFTRQAIERYRKTGHPFSLAFGLYSLAESLHRQRNVAASLSALNEAVAIYEQYPNAIGFWRVLDARSTYSQSLGHADAAIADAERAYAVAKRIGSSLYLTDSAKHLAAIAAGQGDHRRAYALLAEADALSMQADHHGAGTRMLTLAKRYESASKQREVSELNLRNERQAAVLHQQSLQFRWLSTLVIGGFSILFMAVFLLLHLRQSNNRLQRFQRHQQAILDAIPDLMFEMGLDGRYYSCHTLCSDLLVAPASSLLGKTVSDVMPKEAAEVCLSALQEAYEKGVSTSKVLELPLPQGTSWFELSVARKATESGEEPRFIGISRDITARKQLEIKLNARECEFRTLAENSPDNIARYDSQCRIRYINPQLEKTMGVDSRALLGSAPNDADYPIVGNYGEYDAKVASVLRTGQDDEYELTLPDTGEGERYHHVRFVAERDDGGNVVGVLAIGRDVTEHRRVERLLLNLSNGIPGLLGAYRQRPDGSAHQLFASPGLYDIFGVTFDEVKHDSTPRLKRIHPDDLAASLSIMENAVRTMSPAWNEVRVNHPDKGEIWVETHATPVREDDGSVIWYGYSAEVTARHRLQDALKAREREFRTLAENAPDNIARYDHETRMVYVNPVLLRTHGWVEGEAIGKRMDEVFPHHEAILRYQKVLEQVVATGLPATFEMVSEPVGGDRALYDLIRLAPEFDAAGNVIGVIGIGRDITEHKRMEQALIQREREFRTLAENAPDCIARYDSEMRTVYINPALELALELSMTEVIGKRVDEIFPHYEPMVRYQAVLEQVIASGKPATFEMESKSDGEGHVFYDLIRFAPELDAEGHVVGVIAIGHDYSEQKRLGLELMRREHEFRTLAENSPSVIVRYDLDCRRTYVNRTYLEVNPHGVDVALGSTPLDFWNVLSLSAEEYMGHLRNIIATGEPDNLLVELLSPDGLIAYHTISLVPEFNELGQVAGVLSICHDVTYIKRIEAMLRKSELEFRTLAENSPEMIVRYDHNCRRVYINPAYEKQTGIPIKAAWNKTPDDVWKPDLRREEYVMRIRQVMNTGEPDHILLEWRGADDEMVSHLMHAVAEYDEHGVAVGVLVIGHNITKLKLTERQLEKSQQLLRQLAARSEVVREDERKSLAREVHDELGQHLMAIRMNVAAFGLEFGVNSPVLKKEVAHLIALVDATISVVRNVVVLLRPHALDMGIVPALEWLVDEYQARTGTLCEMHIEDNNFYLDDKRATAVFRIVQESLTNIGKHAKASKVDIVLKKIGSWYALQVRDNGVGFDTKKRKEKSFGLVGMRERVLMLGGELEVSSVIGHGTVIKVSIPVNDVRSEEE